MMLPYGLAVSLAEYEIVAIVREAMGPERHAVSMIVHERVGLELVSRE